MGWMTWNLFGGDIDERLIRDTADALVETGLRDAGYAYVCVDDLWQGGRGADGRLYADPDRFPRGIGALADHVHRRGLKLGLYADAGTATCGGAPGSFGFEQLDAETFAAWGVDYLKYDYCNAPRGRGEAIRRYAAMGAALRATRRPMVYALCEWGIRRPWEWGPSVGAHLWRTTGDVLDTWFADEAATCRLGILDALDRQAGLHWYAGRGWHDPDMLVVGLRGAGVEASRSLMEPGCSDVEYRSQMSLWSILAAPLLATCDLRALDHATHEILVNPEILAISQDPLGVPGRRVAARDGVEVWARPLTGGSTALGVLNRGATAATPTFTLDELGLAGAHRVRDAWDRGDLGTVDEGIAATVAPHATTVLVCTPADRRAAPADLQQNA